ncbi:P2X purinoceptor 4b [Hypomesus transpacificus]|uniref:P2X purinoceptor 4b n=1 Tax=Hypomesus transpacificus TaxID=137520 RepID=UPI001F07592A|nr:P2X purinoceptor 4b [Hypomesus transpacificus]
MTKTTCCCHGCLSCFFDYETPRTIVIQSKGVGLLFRFINFLIIAYVFGYVCYLQKGYQDTDSIISSVTTKVKGYSFTNSSNLGPHIWDVADFVIPPQGENSFFVLTNAIITPRQTQSSCPELPTTSTICIADCDCTEGFSDPRGNGIQTGLCVNYSDTIKTCEVQSWCPLELDVNIPEQALLGAAENFTVLIKNSVTYPKFNFHGRNIMSDIVNTSYLKRCEFNRQTDPHCPIFHLKTMVSEAEEEFQTMAVKGGVLGILIDWTCDLDWWGKPCRPQYTFRRLDDKNPTNNVAPGYNFRFAKYFYNSDGKETRTLIKAYGIRFDVIVFGNAGKFSIVPTIVNLGAALSFLSLTGAVCDWVLVTCTRRRHYYLKHKTTVLDDSDDTTESLSMGTTYGTH